MDIKAQKHLDLAEQYLVNLVRADTARNKSGNRATRPIVQNYADRFNGLGVRTKIVPLRSDPKNHAGLILSYGPQVDGGLALSGHIDVVSVDGQDWSHPPFELTQDQRKYYGRGVTDMKGFLAAAMSAMELYAQAKIEIAKPVHIVISCDEEGGFKCAPLLAKALGPLKPAHVIVGEPTEGVIGVAHKGSVKIDVSIKGRTAHSGSPELGINANEILLMLGLYAMNMAKVLKNQRDDDFSPPHAVLNLGIMNGGSAHNIVSSEANGVFFLRQIKDSEADEFLSVFEKRREELIATFANPHVNEKPRIKIKTRRISPFDGRGNTSTIEFMRRLIGPRARIATLPFNTEADFFQRAGFSTLVCGHGSIKDAHQPDEELLKSNFLKGLSLTRKLFAATNSL